MYLSTINELKLKTKEMKLATLEMCKKSGQGYPSSSYSCAEILVILYYHSMHFDSQNPNWIDRDRFYMSKGHGSTILYPILKDQGFLEQNVLDQYLQLNGEIGLMLKPGIPGVECVSGSLGLGLGVAAGVALGAKMSKKNFLTFCIIGDGECAEGSIWEAAMFAGTYRLNNLVVFLDRNYVCKSAFTDELIQLEPTADKWKAFGWDVVSINGHDIQQILDHMDLIRSMRHLKPLIIIADTIKGKGVDFMENQFMWHGAMPKDKLYDDAYSQILNEK